MQLLAWRTRKLIQLVAHVAFSKHRAEHKMRFQHGVTYAQLSTTLDMSRSPGTMRISCEQTPEMTAGGHHNLRRMKHVAQCKKRIAKVQHPTNTTDQCPSPRNCWTHPSAVACNATITSCKSLFTPAYMHGHLSFQPSTAKTQSQTPHPWTIW